MRERCQSPRNSRTEMHHLSYNAQRVHVFAHELADMMRMLLQQHEPIQHQTELIKPLKTKATRTNQ